MRRRRALLHGVAALALAGAAAAGLVQWMARSRDAAPAARAPIFPVSLDSLSTPLAADVAALAADSMEGRRTGTAGAARARRYVARRLALAGASPIGGSYEHLVAYRDRAGAEQRAVNLVALVPGTTRPGRYLVVSAHYDHLGIGAPIDGDSVYNGADDNASGVAALLAVARDAVRHPPPVSLLLVAFDAEEVGSRGSRGFVARPPVPLDSIAMNVNLDMVGHSQRGELFAVGTRRMPALRPILDSVAARSAVRLRYGHEGPMLDESQDWVDQSDQGSFARLGIPFVYFGVEDHPDYHQPSDEPRTITPAFHARAVELVIDAVRSLARAVAEGRVTSPAPRAGLDP